MQEKTIIYLDNHATTPCDPAVVQAMLPFFSEVCGNASSPHALGRSATEAVQEARERVAALINASPGEIAFTSGATESNNLAILSLARGLRKHTKRNRIVTTKIEHKAVLEPFRQLSREGFEVVYLSINSVGRVDLEAARELVTNDTLLVSVQAANNEIGTIQPIQALAEFVREDGALFHCDAAQAVGKIPVDVQAWDVDLLSLSAHKFYGPKGVGALYIRGGVQALPFEPLWLGGGQEQGLRSGTMNVPGIVGMGKACELCAQVLPEEQVRVQALRDSFERQLLERIPNVRRNGDLECRLPNNSSLTFPGVDAEAIIANTPDLAMSTGSACSSGALEPSYVLQAIGLTREEGYSTLRLGLGRFTTEEDMQKALSALERAYHYLVGMRR
jgi:cysteine desulfurase